MRLFGIVVLIAIFSSCIYSQTEVSGTISGIWTKSGSPYYLVGDALVDESTSLQLMPGTEVYATGHYEIIIRGDFNVLGTEADSVIFSHKDAADGKQWAGISIEWMAPASLIKYCKILNVGYDPIPGGSTDAVALEIGTASPGFRLEHSEIANCRLSRYNVLDISSISATISNTVFRNNHSSGSSRELINIYNRGRGFVHFVNCRFIDNQADGNIEAINADRSHVVIDRCLFRSETLTDHSRSTLLKVSGRNAQMIINNTVFDVSPSVQHNTSPEKQAIVFEDGLLRIFNSVIANGKVYTNNDLDYEKIEAYYSCLVSPIRGQHNFSASPSFVDPVNEDYRLDTWSYCKDAGNPHPLYNDEDGSRNDLGIFGGTGKVISEEMVDFGIVLKDEEVTRDIVFFNNSPEPYRVAFQGFEDDQYFTMSAPGSETIDAYSAAVYTVACRPTEKKTISNNVYFEATLSDGTHPISIPVTGFMDYKLGSVEGRWAKSESPIVVLGDITVPKGKELIIEPGVEVMARVTDYIPISFTVEGSLYAQGTETDSITFSTFAQEGEFAMWDGITTVFDPDAQAPQHLTFTYCRIADILNGIAADFPIVEISNCSFDKPFLWNAPPSDKHDNHIFIEASVFNEPIGLSNSVDINILDTQLAADTVKTEVHILNNRFEGKINGIALKVSGSSAATMSNPTTALLKADITGNRFQGSANAIAITSNTDFVNTASFSHIDAEIRQNVFAQNTYAAAVHLDKFDTMEQYSSQYTVNTDFVNNTFYRTSINAITLMHPAAELYCTNNIIWSRSGKDIDSVYYSKMNLAYNFSYHRLAGPGNLSGTAEFADERNGDFHLTPASPCIDNGNPASPPDPDGSPADIGAFYYPQHIPAFSLKAPSNGALLDAKPDAMTWYTAYMETGTKPYYLHQMATSPDFRIGTIQQQDTTSKTFFTPVENLQPGETYYWRITAFTPWGSSREANEVFSFRLRSPSDLPEIISNFTTPGALTDNFTGDLVISISLDEAAVTDDTPTLALKYPGNAFTDAGLMSPAEESDPAETSFQFTVSQSDEWTWNDYRGDTIYYRISFTNADGASRTTAALPVPVIDENDAPLFTFDSKIFLVATEDQMLELDLKQFLTDEESAFDDLRITAESDRFSFDANVSGSLLQISWPQNYKGEGRIYLEATDPERAATKDTIHIAVSVPSDLEELQVLPTEYTMHQNYPNPFNPATTIAYELPEESSVLLELYSMQGERVMVLRDQVQSAGYHNAHINGAALASGIYLYRLIATGSTSGETKQFIRKMMLLK